VQPLGEALNVSIQRRRPRVGVLAAAVALVLATTPAALASEHEEEDGEYTTTAEAGISCDAEHEEEVDGVHYYSVAAGETVECTATGLDPELEAEWYVDVWGVTADDLDEDFDEEDLEDAPPTQEFGEVVTPAEDGTLTLSFTPDAEIVFGFFEGAVLQFEAEAGEEDEPVYEQYFAGDIYGDFEFVEGDLTCEPDPAEHGGEVTCTAEGMTPGEFDWEVHFLTVRELLDSFTGDGEDFDDFDDFDEFDDEEFEPDVSGTAEADDEGVGTFSFRVPEDEDIEVYFAIAEQEDYLAFYAGEVGSTEYDDDGYQDDDPQVEEKGSVVVPRPTRVDAGAGGSAPERTTPVTALALVLALTAAYTVRRAAFGDR
jgi:hypothetical protein